jgi:UDP-2,4-diacetamido-2,4,6-trideoxy-beta-L-altropyranose hydrolase
MNNLLICSDATTEIGIGHIMRCLALAQAWKAEGGQAFFLSHCKSKALRQRVKAAGIGLIPLKNPHPNPVGLQTTLAHLHKLQAKWLVIDGYHYDPSFQYAIRSAGYRLLLIDDIAHLPVYHADILLNPGIKAHQFSYVCDSATKLLFGPQYVLLRTEFLTRREWPREISQAARKVLLTMGGSDPDNVTLKVIRALQLVAIPGLEVRIIVGSENPHLESLRHAIQYSTCHFQLLTHVTDMPDHLAWADMAVSAGGSTCWELAYMGVPTMVLVLADNQTMNAKGFEQAGMAINLGMFDQVSDVRISDALLSLLNDSEKRRRMSCACQEVVDGRGCSRVVQAIFNFREEDHAGQIKIRPATMLDDISLWQLANDPGVRMNAFNKAPISFEHHVEWLHRKLTSCDTRIWILEFDGSFIAQVRYDKVNKDTAEIDFAVVPTFRGKGFGTKILNFTCQTACSELGVKHLVGLALNSNLSSAHAFVKAGFKLIEEERQVRGQLCSIYKRICKGAK